MKLKSFGCSFIFGTDLSDNKIQVSKPSRLTWPALMAQRLGYDYECFARGGSGNLQIAEHVLTHAQSNDCDLAVIGWTWTDRFDHTNPGLETDPLMKQWYTWKTINPMDDRDLAKFYYKNLHSEYRDKLASLVCVKLIIDTLQQRKIPFVMTYMDHLLFDNQWNITQSLCDLQSYTRPYMTEFEGLNFLDWSKSRNFEISPTLHPTDAAHSAAADLMFKVFDKQNTSDPARPALF